MQKIKSILFSYWTTLVLLSFLGIGAAVATFIENDFGTVTAQVVVYANIWYEIVLVLTIVNMLGIIVQRKMWKYFPRFIFHIAFLVILIGSGLTRYVGFEGIMHIREGDTVNYMLSLKTYLKIQAKQNNKITTVAFPLKLSALGNDFNYKMKLNNNKVLNIKYVNYNFVKQNGTSMGILQAKVLLNNKEKIIKLVGKSGMKGVPNTTKFGDTEITVSFGSKIISLPFAIKLNDFQLDRYPGSMSPSSYASEVTLIDTINNNKFNSRIFMNSTLEYGGYKFFQSSYDGDEKGTVLSVNKDPGTFPTYIGYFLLTLGLILNLFDKKSRFLKLSTYIKQFNTLAIAFLVLTICNINIKANDNIDYLNKYKNQSLKIAKKFGKLVSQNNGRMQPLDSLNTAIVKKLRGRASVLGMNADQVVLGMLTSPYIWQNIKMIKIKTPKLKKILKIDKSRKLVAFSEIFTANSYKIKTFVQEANKLEPKHRGTFERDVLKLDERINIAYMVFSGSLLNIYPKMDNGNNHATNNKWFSILESMNEFDGQNKEMITLMTRGFIGSIQNMDWDKAQVMLDQITAYQQKVGSKVIPSKQQIDGEILFNKMDIFFNLTLAYVFIGFILLIYAFATVFNVKLDSKIIRNIFIIILISLFAIHTFGMALRWLISGHAPWSDTYESLVYIAWSTMLAGVVFFRKSLLTLSATVIMAGIFMFTAHLTGIDPQITNLVPVLKSYWLTIHVSIITGSYGFLGLGAMLGFMSLILFIFRTKKPYLDKHIQHITAINEMALIIGLSFLVIGNFIGGVWANESWGRYWGWDPKETWAYVSIVVYAIVLHLRFIKKLNTPFVFSVASLLAFSSILMTYFGVNFYLSGMHSYATGDPVPVPTWVYILTIVVFIIIGWASKYKELGKLKV